MTYEDEINAMLAKMPSDWRSQLQENRQMLRLAGAPSEFIVPSHPDARTVLRALNINNQGDLSSEASAGQFPKSGLAVPQEVRDEAMEGIRQSYRNNYGGYWFIGVARAIQLAISPRISHSAKERMRMYFDRKTKQDRLSEQFRSKHGKRYWSWLNWGGDAGARWTGSSRFKQLVGRRTRNNPFHGLAPHEIEYILHYLSGL